MSKINRGRVIAGGLIAAIICFVTDGLLHERLLDTDWKAVYAHLGISPSKHDSIGVIYFAVFELGRGFISMFLYAVMRRQFSPGPKTAVLAGMVGWVAFSITGPAQFIPLGFFSNALWIKVAAAQLVTSILAAVVGAALYQDAVTPADSAVDA